MSTKAGVYADEESGLYVNETVCWSDDESPAFIRVSGDGAIKVVMDFDQQPTVTIRLSSQAMDRLAVAWCKHRRLQGQLGGPVGREYGSPDCEYD
ncbi:MAG: hypothetical protein V7739_21075 [Motiliproteus sp.]